MVTNPMEELIQYRRSIINRTCLMGAGAAILLALLHQKAYALGVIVGVFVSSANFLLLSLQVSRFGAGQRPRVLLSFILRYGLLGAVIFFVVQVPAINIFGFLIGYFILQINLFLSSLLTRQRSCCPAQGEAES